MSESRVRVVLPRQDGIGPSFGVRLFIDETEVRLLQDVELLYAVTDATRVRCVLLVTDVDIAEAHPYAETSETGAYCATCGKVEEVHGW